MAVIRERKSASGVKSYHVQVRIRGFPPQTQTFKSKTLAKEWAALTETDLKAGRLLPRVIAERYTVSDLLTRYRKEVLPLKKAKFIRDQTVHLDWWEAKLGRYSLAQLNSNVIGQARIALSTESIGKKSVKVQTKDAKGNTITKTVQEDRVRAPATVVRYMGALSHALNTAVNEWGWIDKSPMIGVRKPKVDNERRRFLSDEEIQRVLTEAKGSENRFLYTVVLLALSTGMRLTEIMSLRWRNVLVEDGADMGLLVMEKTKNGDARTSPLAEDAFKAVMVLRDKAKKDNADRVPANQLLFPSDTVENKPVEIRKAWETCRKRAELDDFRFHDLRHTAGSLLAMSGASTREIAEVLGHKTMAMAKRYSHLTQKHLGSVVANMNQRLKVKPK
jgi:integrase